MRTATASAIVAALVALGCEKTPPSAATEPSPTPAQSPALIPPDASAAATGIAASEPPADAASVGVDRPATDDVESPKEIVLDPASEETSTLRQEVLKRIDLVPNMTPEEKDRLYVSLDRARGMGKVMIIPFASGSSSVGSKEIAALESNLKEAKMRQFAEDPTVIFVVAGYADKKGDPQKNLAISRQRAESVMKALRDKCGVVNLIHPVGMGGAEIFDGKDYNKNRVAEVWAVLP